MKFGYARVSTRDQNLELQLDDLKKHGCDKIFQEKIGALKFRPELEEMLKQLRPGDEVVVWKLDRLGRTMKHLVDMVNNFGEQGVGFISIKDSIDTTTATGRLIFGIFASIAEFERSIIVERTLAGLEAARARGRNGGRPAGLSLEAQKTALMAYQLHRNKELSVKDILARLGLSRATFYRYLDWAKEQNNNS